MVHTSFNLAYCIVCWWRFYDFGWLSIGEKNGFGNLYWTPHIDTIRCTGKFSEKPVIILLFIAKVVAFLKVLFIYVFNSLDNFFHPAFEIGLTLKLHFFRIFIHLSIKVLHFLVTVGLFVREFFLGSSKFYHISHIWVQTINFDIA